MGLFSSKHPKDGRSRGENLATQPLLEHRVFNNPAAVTEGWYPLCPSKRLKKGKARSFVVGAQRIAIYRGADGIARAMDAFCPHMGADLGNGEVLGNELRCYFHQWRFAEDGRLAYVPCGPMPSAAPRLRQYPVEERYGFLWVFSSTAAPYPVIAPAGLEGEELSAFHVLSRTLYAHHHVMMANGIDLQHFRAVHGLDVSFTLSVKEQHPQIFDWELDGELPASGLRAALARLLLGDRLCYTARFAGGSLVSVTYGKGEKLLPPLHLLWGCEPLANGVSRVHVFLVTKKRRGIFGRLHNFCLHAVTMLLLLILRDDDAKAFPNMRFSTRGMAEQDGSVAQLVKLINTLPLSDWSHAHT